MYSPADIYKRDQRRTKNFASVIDEFNGLIENSFAIQHYLEAGNIEQAEAHLECLIGYRERMCELFVRVKNPLLKGIKEQEAVKPSKGKKKP